MLCRVKVPALFGFVEFGADGDRWAVSPEPSHDVSRAGLVPPPAGSTGEDLTRGTEFLFSRNRLNVAISRARCLAYLVCTEDLLNTRVRTVADMRLLATLNAFVERANQHASQRP